MIPDIDDAATAARRAASDGDFALAIHILSEHPHLSGSAELLALRALYYKRTEQWRRAIEDSSNALAVDPMNSMALFNRAVCHGEEGHHELAIADMTRYLGINNGDPEALYVRAIDHLSLWGQTQRIEEVDHAIDDLEVASLAEPSVDVFSSLGLAYWYKQELEKADRAYSRAIDSSDEVSDLAEVYASRGYVRREYGQVSEAIDDLERALQLISADEPEKRERIITVLAQLKDSKKA